MVIRDHLYPYLIQRINVYQEKLKTGRISPEYQYPDCHLSPTNTAEARSKIEDGCTNLILNEERNWFPI